MVRRAKSAQFSKIEALPGLTLTHKGATVRVLVPSSTAELPKELARLQVLGLDLADLHASSDVPEGALKVAITPVPRLPTGKAAAAAAHAAQVSAIKMDKPRLHAFSSTGYQVVVFHPALDEWNELLRTAEVVIHDAGFTLVEPGTATSLAIWH